MKLFLSKESTNDKQAELTWLIQRFFWIYIMNNVVFASRNIRDSMLSLEWFANGSWILMISVLKQFQIEKHTWWQEVVGKCKDNTNYLIIIIINIPGILIYIFDRL